MKRSEHFNVVAGKWLNGYPLSVNGHKYFISGVNSDNKLVLHCSDAKDISCDYSDLFIGSSHIFVNECDHVICDARRVFSRLCSATWTVMVKLLIAIPTRDCIVFVKRLRLSIGFPFIVPFHKFNPDNIGESLQHNVVKQQ